MPPFGRLDLADRSLDRAGERALLVAEQLALEQVLGDRRAVDRDERRPCARAQLVQRAGEQFLAGAAPPSSITDTSADGDALDRLGDLQHLGRRGDDRAEHGCRRRRSPAAGSPPAARAGGTRARRSGRARRCRTAWCRSRRRPAPIARSALSRASWPVATITLVSGFRRRISSSIAKPSSVPSGSGGRPRSIVTTAGSCARSASIAAARSPAQTTSIAVIRPFASAAAGPRRPRRRAGRWVLSSVMRVSVAVRSPARRPGADGEGGARARAGCRR